jgi:biotin carboxylase
MKKLAILGASYLQYPLVSKASEMGIETHVFAWSEGNVVGDICDFFYPISILDKNSILEKCIDIEIDGIISIGSDIAMPTINYVAEKLHLVGNSLRSTRLSTDKFEMRMAFQNSKIPCPRFYFFNTPNFSNEEISFPVIIKPTDRSGSRGVTKVTQHKDVNAAIEKALENSINKRAIVEEFMVGREFSVEMISYQGVHNIITITDKITTGSPFFVEIEHHQPADITKDISNKIEETVKSGLQSLGIENGASHSEVFLTENNEIRIIEIAARMGGELIGSHLVPLSTGYDYIKHTIEISLGIFEGFFHTERVLNYSGIYYILPIPGMIKKITNNKAMYKNIVFSYPIMKLGDQVPEIIDGAQSRAGIIVYKDKQRPLKLNPADILNFETF